MTKEQFLKAHGVKYEEIRNQEFKDFIDGTESVRSLYEFKSVPSPNLQSYNTTVVPDISKETFKDC